MTVLEAVHLQALLLTVAAELLAPINYQPCERAALNSQLKEPHTLEAPMRLHEL